MGTKASHFGNLLEQVSRLSLDIESLDVQNGTAIAYQRTLLT